MTDPHLLHLARATRRLEYELRRDTADFKKLCELYVSTALYARMVLGLTPPPADALDANGGVHWFGVELTVDDDLPCDTALLSVSATRGKWRGVLRENREVHVPPADLPDDQVDTYLRLREQGLSPADAVAMSAAVHAPAGAA